MSALKSRALLLAVMLPASSAWAQWPSTITAFNDPTRAVDSIGIAHRNGEYWLVAELWGPAATTGQVYVKRHQPGVGFGVRSNIGVDPGGIDRLATVDRHALPSLSIDANTGLNISMQRDAVGYGPTIENVAVNPVTLVPALNPPNLIDDDAALTLDRGRSWIAINDAMADVWSCWTYHAAANDDDVYCRGRQDREQIGGDSVFKALPAFVFEPIGYKLSVAYVQAVNAADRIGRWARKDAILAYNDICAGQP